jgi:hypothetical protein
MKERTWRVDCGDMSPLWIHRWAGTQRWPALRHQGAMRRRIESCDRSQHSKLNAPQARARRAGIQGHGSGTKGVRIAEAKALWSPATRRSFRFADTSPPDAGALACVGSRPRCESNAGFVVPSLPTGRSFRWPEACREACQKVAGVSGASPCRSSTRHPLLQTAPPPFGTQKELACRSSTLLPWPAAI